MKLVRTRDKQGKFAPKPIENAAVYKTILIPVEQVEKLQEVIEEGESFSDKVREAIALFLDKKPKNNCSSTTAETLTMLPPASL